MYLLPYSIWHDIMHQCHHVSDVVIRKTLTSLNIATGSVLSNGANPYYRVSSSSTQPVNPLRVVPCLFDPTILDCVSLESTNIPGWYVRHSYFYAYLEPTSNPGFYSVDASFIILEDFFQPGSVTFYLVHFQTYYISAVGDSQQMMLLEYRNSSFYRNSTSFFPMNVQHMNAVVMDESREWHR